MNFANPLVFLLWIPLGLLIWARETRSPLFRARMPFPSLAFARSLPGTWRTRFQNVPARLMYAGLALAIVALARPQTVLKGKKPGRAASTS